MDQQKAGRFLKELRHEKEMTQEQLAQVFNVSSRTISRWENGTNLPDISLLVEIADFKMVYYNPWDAQYLGYLVVDYSADDYAEEVKRLREYESTEYVGYYSVKEEKTYELLAVNADSYHGFVYALTDGKGRIIYGEQLFCNYFMDLKYEKYIPKEYLLDGFDATTKSDYYKKMLGDE